MAGEGEECPDANSPWCKSGFMGKKGLRYPQTLFVESPYGDGHAQAAGEARGIVDRAHRVGNCAGASLLPEAESVTGSRALDEFVEQRCAKFYAPQYGRPSLTPGIYFRSLLIGYFEGIGAERRFVGIGLDENTPDHSTMSRTRRLIDLDTHREVFSWVLGVLADRGLLQGQRIAVDATTLEANAAMRLKRQRLLPRASAGSDHSV